MIEDRLTDIIAGKNVDSCSKCIHFKNNNDPLDQTKAGGNCSYYSEFCFNFNYCSNFKSKNNIDEFIKNNENQTYNIAIITPDKKYYYFKGIKPAGYYPINYSPCGIELVFTISEIKAYQLPMSIDFIDNKQPNNCMHFDYIISKEDNEKELKEHLIKHCLHNIDEHLSYLEKEKENYRKQYMILSKYLIN